MTSPLEVVAHELHRLHVEDVDAAAVKMLLLGFCLGRLSHLQDEDDIRTAVRLLYAPDRRPLTPPTRTPSILIPD